MQTAKGAGQSSTQQPAGTPALQPRDWPYWIVGSMLGAITGYLQVRVKDPTLSAVLLVAFSMFLAYMRPRRPWRWGLLTALCLPAAELLAYLTREHPTRAAIYGSFVGLAPALAACFGGSVIRRAVNTLFLEKQP
ncbi:MAG TPA: hypothetical protein VKW78_11055 [Terriglobales bacterium]|nr:hypothetical protein [Terriglobales bacterium]